MRIGIDARLWNETGVGRYIRNLVKYLHEIDHNNYYVLFIRREDCDRIKGYQNIKIVKTDIHWHSLAEQVKFPQIINLENIDLMHFPYFAVPVFYNKPYVVTIHDLIIDHFPTGKATTRHPLIYHGKRLSYKYIIRNAAKKSKKIVTVSEATKSEIIKHYKVPDDKVIVTYEGIDERINSQIVSNEKRINLQSLNPKEKYFLYVGNAYPHKNLELLLNAFDEVHKTIENVKFVLVGKEDYFYKHVRAKIDDLNLKDSVLLLHDINDEELSYLYKNALGLVMPSLMEGFGLPAVEAMSLSCLVIASDIPALKEICQDAGIYFDPYKEKELVVKLLERIGDEENAKFKKSVDLGIERSKIFSWQKMARETLKVYESCISLR